MSASDLPDILSLDLDDLQRRAQRIVHRYDEDEQELAVISRSSGRDRSNMVKSALSPLFEPQTPPPRPPSRRTARVKPFTSTSPSPQPSIDQQVVRPPDYHALAVSGILARETRGLRNRDLCPSPLRLPRHPTPFPSIPSQPQQDLPTKVKVRRQRSKTSSESGGVGSPKLRRARSRDVFVYESPSNERILITESRREPILRRSRSCRGVFHGSEGLQRDSPQSYSPFHQSEPHRVGFTSTPRPAVKGAEHIEEEHVGMLSGIYMGPPLPPQPAQGGMPSLGWPIVETKMWTDSISPPCSPSPIARDQALSPILDCHVRGSDMFGPILGEIESAGSHTDVLAESLADPFTSPTSKASSLNRIPTPAKVPREVRGKEPSTRRDDSRATPPPRNGHPGSPSSAWFDRPRAGRASPVQQTKAASTEHVGVATDRRRPSNASSDPLAPIQIPRTPDRRPNRSPLTPERSRGMSTIVESRDESPVRHLGNGREGLGRPRLRKAHTSPLPRRQSMDRPSTPGQMLDLELEMLERRYGTMTPRGIRYAGS